MHYQEMQSLVLEFQRLGFKFGLTMFVARAILALRKKKLAIRVRFEPNNSIDPQNMLKEKVYKPWFFLGNGQERELQIDSITQIDNAMQLISQSYNLV